MADDGGSSGRLRRAYGMLPPGDIRNCLLALSERGGTLAALFGYRFNGHGEISGHSLGNLILAALSHLESGFERAVERAGDILGATGRVLPATSRPVGLEAEFATVVDDVAAKPEEVFGSPRHIVRGPLVHLVRNAVDHGLEVPDVREARGKHREGIVVVRVEQQGNMLFIEVSDDGNGLDLALIKQAARELSIVPGVELDAMAPAQLHQLIFRNGFSTRRTVTEVSGRGVGMDVVRSQIQALQGHIEVQSTPGQGTRFTLTLPAELGSSPVLVVRCGEHELGIPMPAVETSLLARSGELRVARTRVQLSHRDHLIPVQDLGTLLALRQPEVPHDGQPLLVLQSQGRRIALAVDEVIGDRELVIRPLPPEVRDLAAYQGAATLARGELVLIVRPDWLSGFEKRDASLTGTRRALVVDDSLTARALHRTALESGGYSVHTASSGRQALEQLRHSSYDVMVSDIGMDEMDGFELTLEARRRHELEAMAIILVSARDSDADRQRGAASGADGFLSKKDCASGRLLAEVQAVIARRQGAT